MAFASTTLKNGVEGEWKTLTGTWTGSVGDASGTFSTGGSFIRDAKFYPNVTSGPTQEVPVAGLGLTTTGQVTVHNRQAVTSGVFKVVYR